MRLGSRGFIRDPEGGVVVLAWGRVVAELVRTTNNTKAVGGVSEL